MLKQKGQISIFVVIGAIIVIVGIFMFFNGEYEIFASSETKTKNQLSEIVQTCTEESARQGAFLLGFQGGYITIPQEIKVNPFKRVSFGDDSNSPFSIPTWDSETGDVPTILSMQNQLNDYIVSNSLSCINSGVDDLREFLDITVEDDRFSVDTRINSNNIIVETNLPIRFSEKNLEDSENTIADYIIELEDIRLGELYNLAIEIYNKEQETYFVEELVLDQILSANDYSNRQLSMPTEGMTFSCRPYVWIKEELKETLANLNNNNFKYIQFEGTQSLDSNLEELGDNLRQYYDKNYVFPLDSNYEDFAVSMFMPSSEYTGNNGFLSRYPFREFEVTPSSGQLVKALDFEVDGGVKIPVPCIQIFHHLYTLDYDLIVRLDDNTETENSYFFQFPLRVKIENNAPKKAPSTFIATEDTINYNEEFCSEESRIYPRYVYATDFNSGEDLEEVNVTYTCGALRCNLGQTQRTSYLGIEYGDSELETSVPYCYGGRLKAEKGGYFQLPYTKFASPIITDTFDLRPLDDIIMVPTKKFEVDANTFIAKVNYQPDAPALESSVVIQEEGQGLFYVTFENKGLDFESSAIWPNEGEFLNEIELLDYDASYNVTAIYIDSNDELRGLMELQNIKLGDIFAAQELDIVIPASNEPLDENNFLEYLEDVEFYTNPEKNGGINYGFGVRLY